MAEVKAKTVGYTLGDVEAEALVDTLTDTLSEVVAKTIADALTCVEAECFKTESWHSCRSGRLLMSTHTERS